MRRALLFLALAPAVLGVCAGACSADAPTAPEDVIYQGIATDEAWLEIADHPPVTDDAMAPRLTAPTTISSTADAPTFVWDGGAVASAWPRRAPRQTRFAWSELFGPGHARAHSPPVNGALYRLVFTIPGDPAPVRVLTGLTSYTPIAAIWDRTKVATGPLSVELVGAYLTEGRITEGPFRAAEPFSIPVE